MNISEELLSQTAEFLSQNDAVIAKVIDEDVLGHCGCGCGYGCGGTVGMD